MSITPMSTASAGAPATPTGESGADGPVDGTFAALVSTLLGEGQGNPAGTAAAAEATVVPPTPVEEEAVEPAAAEAGEEVVVPVATPLWTALATPLVAAPITVPPSGDQPGEPAEPGAVAAVAEAEAGDPLAAARTASEATSATTPPADVAAVPQPGVPGADQGAAAEGASTSTAGTTTDAAGTTSSDTSQGGSGDQPPAAPAPTRASENEPTPAATPASTGVAPAAATSAPAATSTTTSTDAARPVPVVSQLAPEVTRMVSRGNGLHHVTMLLQPEALGEVRVTLTVRNGEVLVRLAAGDDAQRALLEGAPELRRVLELAGASEARVVVRDLPSAASGNQQGWQSPERFANPDSSGAFGSGGDTHASGQGRTDDQDQHARTRGGSTARDGLTDGAHQLRPNPVTDASRGIDLTM